MLQRTFRVRATQIADKEKGAQHPTSTELGREALIYRVLSHRGTSARVCYMMVVVNEEEM